MNVRCYACRLQVPEESVTIDAGVGPRCTDSAACKARRRAVGCENHECDGYVLQDGTVVDWCPECGAFNDGNGWRLPRRLGGS